MEHSCDDSARIRSEKIVLATWRGKGSLTESRRSKTIRVQYRKERERERERGEEGGGGRERDSE